MDEASENEVVGPDGDGRPIDRRTFIAGAGALTGAAVLDHIAKGAVSRFPTTVSPTSLLGNPLLLVEGTKSPTTTVTLRRREDMLFLRIDGYNLIRKGQKLVRQKPGHDAHVVVTFVPQHLAEQAFFQSAGGGGEKPRLPGATRALLAAPSRLAFTLPNHLHSIPFTVAGLLDWSQLDLSLVPAAAYSPRSRLLSSLGREAHAAQRHAARPGSGNRSQSSPVQLQLPTHFPPPVVIHLGGGIPPIREPAPTETSIELPWHLALSPVAGSQWSHPTQPLSLGGATELWHTRLANASGPFAHDGGALRAVWNFDTQTHDYASPGKPTLEPKRSPPPDAALGPFRMSLTPNDRFQIVKLTSDFALSGRADVQANRLWLSARGAFLDSSGVWDDPKLSLVEWKHLATLGRDHYVKVVKKGFLFPFGHRVVEITVTEREFEKLSNGEIVATSRQIVYLVVREPTMSYDPSATFGIANNSRDFPFRIVTLKTPRTPNLDAPINFVDPSRGSQNATFFSGTPFVPTVAGTPFMWHFVGTDWVGREIPFTAQAVFVIYEDAVGALPAAIVRNQYNGLDPADPVRVAHFGKTIAFAESIKTGDTDLVVKTMTFGASPGAGGTVTDFQSHDTAHCYPTLAPSINGADTGARAVVRLASAEQASGGAPIKGNPSPAVAYYPPYVSTGFSTSQQPTGNAGNVYMEILFDAGSASNLSFGNGSSGGVLTPNLQLQGISRSLGPVADLDNIFHGSFDPSTVFAGLSDALSAKILGAVPLSELLAPVTSFLDGGTPEIPNAKALRITYTTDGNVVTTSVVWKPDVRTDNPIVTGGNDISFELDATTTTDLTNPNNSSFLIVGTLKNFTVNLVSNGADQFIAVAFKELTFTSASGQKANVHVDVKSVNFVGPLKFVEQLESFMNFGGSGGPKIQILPTGITADLLVELPTIAVGLFSLSHVGIDANFTLPFDGSPAVFGFGFSTRANPFQLSIAIFGGGGYFGIKITTGGVIEIDAGFDFGAMAAINLGVASGSVSLTAGFQFSWMLDQNTGKNTCTLTGFVKLTGSLSILGIITMSLEFDLSLTYKEISGGGGSSVTGTATVSISISILFFHFSVSATASKTFTNSGPSGHSLRGHAVRGHLAQASTTPTFADQMAPSDWQAYCQAFAT